MPRRLFSSQSWMGIHEWYWIQIEQHRNSSPAVNKVNPWSDIKAITPYSKRDEVKKSEQTRPWPPIQEWPFLLVIQKSLDLHLPAKKQLQHIIQCRRFLISCSITVFIFKKKERAIPWTYLRNKNTAGCVLCNAFHE